MLLPSNDIIGRGIAAQDGEIGKVKDLYFDDGEWVVRYLVVDAGKWLPGRQVLITPGEVRQEDWQGEAIAVKLTRQQVQDAPGIEEDVPVSRQHESKLAQYYGWVPYWGAAVPMIGRGEFLVGDPFGPRNEEEEPQHDVNLRSMKVVAGYGIRAKDEAIGHVEGFVVETSDWSVRYIIVDTRNWLPGRKVLISPHSVERTDWDQRLVKVSLTAEVIRGGPEYDFHKPISREYERELQEYYRRLEKVAAEK